MHVAHTAAEPPNQGRISLAMIGCSAKRRNALANIVRAYRTMGHPYFAPLCASHQDCIWLSTTLKNGEGRTAGSSKLKVYAFFRVLLCYAMRDLASGPR